MRDIVRQYESSFARTVEAPAARAFGMGRVALYVGLKALGIGPGARVGVCGYTCLSVAEAVLRTGAACEFLDVDEQINIDPTALNALPEGRINALITQYTFGVPSNLDATLKWAANRSVPVVEDCAHSLGSRWAGRQVGSFGAAAIYSFQWGKSYSTGQGGMLTVNDPALLARVDEIIAREGRPMRWKADLSLAAQRQAKRLLANSITKPALRALYGVLGRRGLVQTSFSLDFDRFVRNEGFVRTAGRQQARAGLAQLRRWADNRQRRVENAARIRDFLQSHSVEVAPIPALAEPVFLRVPFRTGRKAQVLAEAHRRRLEVAGWYSSVVHPLDSRQLDYLGYRGQCPRAEEAIAKVVHLPTRERLSARALQATIDIVRQDG